MSEETTPQNSLAPEAVAPETPTPASPDASAPSAEKPAWLPDEKYYDASTGVKYEDLGRELKELSDFKTKFEAEAAARKAEMPESADGYGYAPEGFELPADYKVDTESPMWKLLQETAYERGLTKTEYAAMASKFIEASNAHQEKYVAGLQHQRDELMKQLGEDSGAQIASVKNWFKSAAGDDAVAAQLSETLWTPGIVRFWQKVQKQLTSQGAAGFNGLGRDGAGGGDDADFAKLSFVEKWHRSTKTDRRAS